MREATGRGGDTRHAPGCPGESEIIEGMTRSQNRVSDPLPLPPCARARTTSRQTVLSTAGAAELCADDCEGQSGRAVVCSARWVAWRVPTLSRSSLQHSGPALRETTRLAMRMDGSPTAPERLPFFKVGFFEIFTVLDTRGRAQGRLVHACEAWSRIKLRRHCRSASKTVHPVLLLNRADF